MGYDGSMPQTIRVTACPRCASADIRQAWLSRTSVSVRCAACRAAVTVAFDESAEIVLPVRRLAITEPTVPLGKHWPSLSPGEAAEAFSDVLYIEELVAPPRLAAPMNREKRRREHALARRRR